MHTDEGFTDNEARDELMTSLIAGSDSTGSTLVWALTEIAQCPDAEQHLHAEVDGVYPAPVAKSHANQGDDTVRQLADRIRSEVIGPETTWLPSVQALVQQFDSTIAVTSRALALLREDGVLLSVPRFGHFFRQPEDDGSRKLAERIRGELLGPEMQMLPSTQSLMTRFRASEIEVTRALMFLYEEGVIQEPPLRGLASRRRRVDARKDQYRQLADRIRSEAIGRETTWLPSVRALVQQFDSTIAVTCRALALLCEDGVLLSVPSAGYLFRRPEDDGSRKLAERIRGELLGPEMQMVPSTQSLMTRFRASEIEVTRALMFLYEEGVLQEPPRRGIGRGERQQAADPQKYPKLAERIRAEVITPEMQMLPSVQSLATHFGTTTRAIMRALAILRAEGLLISVPGTGSLINRPATDGGVASPLAARRPITDGEYLFHHLAERIRREIIKPRTKKLPSVRDLQERFEVSNMTVQRALGVLRDEGVIYTVNGLGSFVERPRSTRKSPRDRGTGPR